MRSDARKRFVDDLRAIQDSLSPHYVRGHDAGRQEVIDQLRAIVTRHKPHGTFPAIVAVSDLYTLIGDPTTWHDDGGDAA